MFSPIAWFDAQEKRRKNNERRLETAEFQDWHPEIKWARELNIVASSYNPPQLFDVRPFKGARPQPNKAEPDQYVRSPSGVWQYQINELSTGTCLSTWSGSKLGTVMFDDPVLIPSIFRRVGGRVDREFDEIPWMSLTPAELLSLRVGTRKARGHVIVAGLGMGHQLAEVCKRKNVERVTLVEKDQDIIDWILPVVKPQLGDKLLDVIVGDAYKKLPKLSADVALIDIFKSYGNNSMDIKSPPNIKKVWVWGASPT